MTTMAELWLPAQQDKLYVSAIWSVPCFTLSYIRPDWMNISCLGVLQYLQGNVLWELFVELGGTWRKAQEACSKLENIVAVCARRLGRERPVNCMTVTMIRQSATAKPKFKVTSAEGRHFLPILVDMLSTTFSCATAHAQLRLSCAKALLGCYHELEHWVPGESPHKLATHARQHLLLYCRLRQESVSDRMWNLFPKHHLLIHVAEGAVTNPRLEWNYGDESEIGLAVKEAMASHKVFLPVHLIQRYRATFTM